MEIKRWNCYIHTDVVISRRDAEAQRLKSQKFFRVISYHFVVPNSPQKPPSLFFSIFSVFRRRPQRQRPLLTDVVVLDFISRRDAEAQRLFVHFRAFRVTSNTGQQSHPQMKATATATTTLIRVPIIRANLC